MKTVSGFPGFIVGPGDGLVGATAGCTSANSFLITARIASRKVNGLGMVCLSLP